MGIFRKECKEEAPHLAFASYHCCSACCILLYCVYVCHMKWNIIYMSFEKLKSILEWRARTQVGGNFWYLQKWCCWFALVLVVWFYWSRCELVTLMMKFVLLPTCNNHCDEVKKGYRDLLGIDAHCTVTGNRE